LGAALVAAFAGAPAPGPAQERLRQELDDDVALDAHWVYDDWAEARRRAAAEKKPIFAVFRCVP
jgi:hypothetical protein